MIHRLQISMRLHVVMAMMILFHIIVFLNSMDLIIKFIILLTLQQIHINVIILLMILYISTIEAIT